MAFELQSSREYCLQLYASPAFKDGCSVRFRVGPLKHVSEILH
jgi:hypothetical protein